MTPDISADSHAGEQEDMFGKLIIEWRADDENDPGWYYKGGGTEDGPFNTSKEAYDAASEYGDIE